MSVDVVPTSTAVGRPGSRRVVQAVVALIAAAVLSGCTGDSESLPKPSPATSAAMPPATPGVIEGGFDDLALPAAAIVSGTLQVSDGDLGLEPMKATAEIVSVIAGPESTSLSWRLIAPETTSLPSRGWFVRGLGNTSAVALVAGDQLLRPVMWQEEGNQFDWFVDCGCSRVPFDVGPEGVEMGGVYPALPASATSVQVRIPGFPAATVPLTRL